MTADCAAIAARRARSVYGQDYQELRQVAEIAAWRAKPGTEGIAAVREIQDHLRRETKSRRQHLIPHRALEWQERADDHGQSVIARQIIERAMDQLPFRWRRAIELRYWHGYSLTEIGEWFGVGESRAHQMVTDGLKRMREVMA
jgi:RNA polymerase sigma factor (sigma-70 family)